MRRPVFFPALCLVFLFGGISAGLGAVDFTSGCVRLTLHKDTGRFSFYYTPDLSGEKFDPLFVTQDPRTTFFSLISNDKTYRLGESAAFRFRLEEDGLNPSIVFESAFLRVREEFAFIKTAGSSLDNGIQITLSLENLSPQQVSLGLRFLVDTNLGEGVHGAAPFFTDKRPIDSETLITLNDDDRWWVSRNDKLSLMGNISAGVERRPDLVHFANWKRLNDAPWKTSVSTGRNFNYLPYSIGDSAVCYYYEPRPLSRGDTLRYTILLAAEDENGFVSYGDKGKDISPPSDKTVPLSGDLPLPAGSKEADLALLKELINRIDQYVAGEISLTEEELALMETTAARLKARYGLP
ncbi:MAG: hypothetical protein LBL28_06120 [Treponema sp.]|jgi:hypothetical protein|nr:hypothetical protein [Treponema sp.]